MFLSKTDKKFGQKHDKCEQKQLKSVNCSQKYETQKHEKKNEIPKFILVPYSTLGGLSYDTTHNALRPIHLSIGQNWLIEKIIMSM